MHNTIQDIMELTWKQYKKIRRDYYLKYIKGNKLIICSACNGSGQYDDSNNPKCSSCNGKGKIRERYIPPFWSIHNYQEINN